MKRLRQYIRGILLEGYTPPSAVEAKFALWTDFWDYKPLTPYTEINFVMYDYEKAKKDFFGINDENPDGDDVSIVQYGINNSIKAVMRVETPKGGTCNGAWQVIRAAAVEGYGPTLYDLVMSISPAGLMSDRESASNDARKVWKFYANNRPDVDKKFLDPENLQITEFEEDDCNTWGMGAGNIKYATINVAKQWLDDNHPELHDDWQAELDSMGFKNIFTNGAEYHGRMMYWLRRERRFDDFESIDHDAFHEYYHDETYRNLMNWNKEEFRDPEYLNLSYNIDNEDYSFKGMQDNHDAYLEYAYHYGNWPFGNRDIDVAIENIDNEIEDVVIDFFKLHYND